MAYRGRGSGRFRSGISTYPLPTYQLPTRPDVCSITDDSCSKDIGKLFNNEQYSDLILNVDGTKFFAHKNILAIRSEYFRTMLSSDMSESSKKEIPIVEYNVGLFEKLLRYIYTGQMEFIAHPMAQSMAQPRAQLMTFLTEIIGMFTLANKYVFTELQRSIEMELESRLSPSTFCTIYSAVYNCSAEKLIHECLSTADAHPFDVLQKSGFSFLQVGAVKEVITRKSFEPYQTDVFTAVSKWISTNGGKEMCSEAANVLLSEIQLQSMPMHFLKQFVRPSGLFPDSRILDAIFETHA